MDKDIILGVLILLLFLLSMTALSFSNYYFYLYLKKTAKVSGYLDFMAYNWGQRNAKNYRVMSSSVRDKDEDLYKAHRFVIAYQVLLASVIVLLLMSFVFN